VINIQDYLQDFDDSDSFPAPDGEELLEFNEVPSRQEIGRWVDKLVELPEDHRLEDGPEHLEVPHDPYQNLAQILISNDLV
jgi:hypothetical protein